MFWINRLMKYRIFQCQNVFLLPFTLDIHFLCIDPALVFHSSATTPDEGVCTSLHNTSKTKGNISARIYIILIKFLYLKI